MSSPVLTDEEMRDLYRGCNVLVGYYMGLQSAGLPGKPCFLLWTADAGWNERLYVCACDGSRILVTADE